MQHLQDRLAYRLGLQPAAHFLGDRVHKGDVHVDIGTQHRFTDGVEGNMQALFFLEEGLVKLLHLGHVHVDAEQSFDFALFIQHPVRQRANMAHAFLHANAKFQLKRQTGDKRVSQNLLCMGAIFRQHCVVPELPGGFDVRRNFIQLKHPLIPANNVWLQIPLPDANSARFVSQRNALHQTFIDPFGLLQVVNIFNLGDKIER